MCSLSLTVVHFSFSVCYSLCSLIIECVLLLNNTRSAHVHFCLSAQIQAGDILTEIDGVEVSGKRDLLIHKRDPISFERDLWDLWHPDGDWWRARARAHTHTHTHAHTHTHMHTCTHAHDITAGKDPEFWSTWRSAVILLFFAGYIGLFYWIYRSLSQEIQVSFTGLFYRSLLQDIQVSFLSNRALLPAGKDPEFLKYLTLGAEMSLCNIGIYRDGFNYSVPVLFFFSFHFFPFFSFSQHRQASTAMASTTRCQFFFFPPPFFSFDMDMMMWRDSLSCSMPVLGSTVGLGAEFGFYPFECRQNE